MALMLPPRHNRIHDCIQQLKLMKFYYNLSYNLVPSYFNCDLEVIDDDLPCQYALRQTSTSTNMTTNDTTCFYRVHCLTSIDTVIKLYTHTHTHNIQQ